MSQPNQYTRLPMPDRFWAKVDRSGGPATCWPWMGHKHYKGYGVFWLDGNTEKAQRVAWQIVHGPIPEGLHVLHHCDNPPCCSPAHLWLGTNQDNVDDKMAKGRLRSSSGERNGSAKLRWEDARQIRQRFSTGNGQSRRALSAEFGVSLWQIYRIGTGKSWIE